MSVRFFLNMDKTNIRPKICGRRACPPGWHVVRDNTPHYLLHYVLQGTGTFWKNGKEYSLSAGDLFIMQPGQSTVYEASTSDPWEYCWISFLGTGDFESLLLEDVIHLPRGGSLFIQMYASEYDPGREWKITGLVYQLLAMIAQQKPKHKPKKSYVDQTIDYIEKHYQEELQVGTLSDRLGLNRSYFCRVFKDQTGMTPQDYVVHYRLRQAEKLLFSTEMTQKEIAKAVGYPDIYAFSRMFKRKYGVAPGVYRASRHPQSPKSLEE